MPDAMTLQAPAKLNLALSVGPPDGQGMHPVCTWMVTVDLCDELTVTRLPADRLSRYAVIWHEQARRPSEIDWSMTRDLAVRAHLALERRSGRVLPVQMKLEKRIPVGGGLGGGSSDAAAMLRAVNQLYELDLCTDELCAIAAELGADVPFFVRGGSAIVEGFGERIDPQPPRELHAVIAFPDASCPTGRIYGAFDEHAPAACVVRDDAVRALATTAQLAAEALFNDLADAAVRVEPVIGEHLGALGNLAERPAQVTGSGSSLFVLCDDELHATYLAEAVEKQLSLPAVAVRTVSLDEP